VSFASITLCVASQRVFVVVDFVIESVRKLLDTPSYKPMVSANIVYEQFNRNGNMSKKIP
jgi:hypothetical protein